MRQHTMRTKRRQNDYDEDNKNDENNGDSIDDGKKNKNMNII